MEVSNSAYLCLKSVIATGVACVALSAPALAQSDDANVAQYKAILNEIANLQITMDRQSVYISTQEAEMESLSAQIAQVEQTNLAIPAMIDKMVVALDDHIKTDLPFKAGERYTRLDSLKETVADATARPSDKMRKALNMFDIEVSYGRSLEAYDADSPTAAGVRRKACAEDLASSKCALTDDLLERFEEGATFENLKDMIFDGTYLRYGRLSLAYIGADGSEALRYNSETGAWDALPATKALEVRRGIRIAKGESAPGVVSAPVIVSN